MNFITKLVVWDHIFGWKEGLPSDISVWLKQLQANWSNLNSGLSYGAGASIYHQDDSLYRPDYLGNWHPERWQSYLHERYYSFAKNAPFLWGVFIANMFDYGAAGREWGDGTGVDDRGLVTFDRKYRKDAFYFYKANWNPDEPFALHRRTPLGPPRKTHADAEGLLQRTGSRNAAERRFARQALRRERGLYLGERDDGRRDERPGSP